MDKVVTELMREGTIVALFLAFLIVILSYLVIWARKMLEEQKISNAALLEQKDKRIDNLEREMFNIQNYIKKELHDIILENQKVMSEVLFHIKNQKV